MKDFVPYQPSFDMKELGFNETCFGFYNPTITKDVIINNDSYGGFGLMQDHIVVAPTFSQAFRWFREKYGLYSWITMELGNKSTFCWVLSGEHTSTQYAAYFHTYEEAELACLIKLIEIKKNDK